MLPVPESLSLAIEHHQAGRMVAAEVIYRQILAVDPDQTDAWHLLGVLALQVGRPEKAIEYIEHALRLSGANAGLYNNLGEAHRALQNLPEAIACYVRALQTEPDFTRAHSNLGQVLEEQGRLDEAIACYRGTVQLLPNFGAAHYNLGRVLTKLGERMEAVACFERALQLNPDNPARLGDLVHQLQHVCLWSRLRELSQRAVAAVEAAPSSGAFDAMSPFAFLALAGTVTTAEQQWRCARQWVDQHPHRAMRSGQQQLWRRPKVAPARITVGYLSVDFRTHPVAECMVELLERHDRHRFSILGYSYGPDDGSPLRQRVIQAVDQFVDIRDCSAEQAAQRIAEDGVDILVDLTGYTENSRIEILAHRPAPIQVNFLGYPGTTGAPFMDFILVDEFVVPADQQSFFTEKLVHLPGCYLPASGQRQIPKRSPSRAECGLPQEGFVFCSFNNSFKLAPDVFDVWMDLLSEVPGSVLWLAEGNRFMAANLRREAESRGVGAERLVFAPRLPDLSDHLARYRVADLFLDTFPYNAHATAADALWAGCPVLTRAGETFASRVAGSLLRTVGLPELITTSLEQYRAMALRLATEPGLLRAFRIKLESNSKTSPLFDADRFAAGIEQAYLTMWDNFAHS